MTKKETQQWLKELGYDSFYSGKEKTLFVEGISQEMLDGYMLETSGFKLKADV